MLRDKERDHIDYKIRAGGSCLSPLETAAYIQQELSLEDKPLMLNKCVFGLEKKDIIFHLSYKF